MKITELWLGTEVLDDGTPSFLLEDAHLALQWADWMTLTDEEGWPRATKPGDIFWSPLSVAGNGEAKLRLKGVQLSSVLPCKDPLVASIIGMIQSPPEDSQKPFHGITGKFGMGGTNRVR
jgi:hypothetical protein